MKALLSSRSFRALLTMAALLPVGCSSKKEVKIYHNDEPDRVVEVRRAPERRVVEVERVPERHVAGTRTEVTVRQEGHKGHHDDRHDHHDSHDNDDD